jgi:rhodanese-related sulfurtransferase
MRRTVICVVVMMSMFVIAAPLPASAEPQASVKTPAREMLEAREAFTLIQTNSNNPQFVILDVRTPEEFDGGHIAGAINININTGGFKTEVGELDKKKTFFVYCRTGRRSGEAVKIMRSLGFTDIIQMKGDILKWQSENLPLVK